MLPSEARRSRKADHRRQTEAGTFRRSVDLARHVELSGYKRYWLAEHHSIAGLACSATPVLIGHIAGATKTIRVGSGGVMLPNHAPLVVAEEFGTLDALYPERIDLGLGGLLGVIRTQCGLCDGTCTKVEMISRGSLRNCEATWERKSQDNW